MDYNEPTYEVSNVKYDVCNYNWVAVRPEGLIRLECPHCGGMRGFENQENITNHE
jgi:hypothetical protein